MNRLRMSFSAIQKKMLQMIRRRRFVRSVRPRDVFLVTYPKSGTTWLGFLLANILHGARSSALNLRTYLEYIPDINDLNSSGGDLSQYSHLPDPRFFSTHSPYEPAFSRVIYMLRDPRDVMVSYWHHTRLLDPSFDLSFKDFITRHPQWPSDWHEHVQQWAVDKHANVIVLKYEHLKVDALHEVRKVLDFIDYGWDDVIVRRAIEASKFERMKALEVEHGSGRHADSLKGFLRAGKSGSWRDEIEPETLAVLESRYESVMEAVGYEPYAAKSVNEAGDR